MNSPRTLAFVASFALALAISAAACGADDSVAARRSTPPQPLRGTPLTGRTGLQVLVSDDPPFVLNLDSGRVTRIRGLPAAGNPVLSVLPVGDDTVVWLDHLRPAEAIPRAAVYLIRHGSTLATKIASGWQVAPDRSGRALWLISYRSTHRCVLSELTLAGRTTRSPRPVPCSAQLIDSGSGAILVDIDTATDPATGRVLLHGSRLWAIADDYALSSDGPQAPLTLTDLHTGSSRQLAWPSRIGSTDQAIVDPQTGLIALDFADPAYGGTGTQVTDTWLLNPKTGRFHHLPDMPAAVHLKFTSMAWTHDGRLVTLAGTSGGTAGQTLLAIWKPGERQLRVRSLLLPTRTSGSDSFSIEPS